MILKFITHDVVNNTLEATWLREVLDEATGEAIGYKVAKSRNYSADQKADFEADTGLPAYTALAGW
jgi:hypothetical protein